MTFAKKSVRPSRSPARDTGARDTGARDTGEGLGDAVPQCVCGALRTVTRAVTQYYDDAMRPVGLRITQYGLLVRIGQLQPVSAAALVDALHADQTTLARALKVLEKEGLIHRASAATGAKDQRVKAVALTALGRRRVAEARKLWRRAQQHMVGLIGDARWGATRQGLQRVLAAAGNSAVSPR